MPRSRPHLRCEPLENRTVPAFVAPPTTPIPKTAFVIASAPGVEPTVTIYNADGTYFYSLNVMGYFPSDTGQTVPYFTGGVSAALADVTGDGNPDVIAAAGAGGGPRVQVFDGVTYREVRSFFAYAPNFRGGVNLAAGDVTGDGVADIVTGAGAGGAPHVKVFDGKTGAEVRSFLAYDPGFLGGVNVAVAERSTVERLGAQSTYRFSPGDIVTGAGAGGAPHVKAFDGKTGAVTQSFMAFDPAFRGGVDVAVLPAQLSVFGQSPRAGDPGTTTVSNYPSQFAVSQASGGSQVSTFDYGGRQLPLRTFEPFDGTVNGVRLAAHDLTGNGLDDLIVGAGSGNPRVRTYNLGDASKLIAKLDFTVEDPSARGGANVG